MRGIAAFDLESGHAMKLKYEDVLGKNEPLKGARRKDLEAVSWVLDKEVIKTLWFDANYPFDREIMDRSEKKLEKIFGAFGSACISTGGQVIRNMPQKVKEIWGIDLEFVAKYMHGEQSLAEMMNGICVVTTMPDSFIYGSIVTAKLKAMHKDPKYLLVGPDRETITNRFGFIFEKEGDSSVRVGGTGLLVENSFESHRIDFYSERLKLVGFERLFILTR